MCPLIKGLGEAFVWKDFLFIYFYLHFIYRWQYIKTQDWKVQLNYVAVQIIR